MQVNEFYGPAETADGTGSVVIPAQQFEVPANSPGQIMFVAGSAWNREGGAGGRALLKLTVQKGGAATGPWEDCCSFEVYSNAIDVHRALIPRFVPLNLGGGTHWFQIVIANSRTKTNEDDFFTITLLELEQTVGGSSP